MVSAIKKIFFGERAKGMKVPPPTLHTYYPTYRPSLNQWSQEVKFGSRYGHKGSFYKTGSQNK
jgi:hypothetical protein